MLAAVFCSKQDADEMGAVLWRGVIRHSKARETHERLGQKEADWEQKLGDDGPCIT